MMNKVMMNGFKGFTLVELVVVIAILGILAATALPRFADIQTDARIATMNGYAAAVRSGATLARSAWTAQGSKGNSVTLDNAAGAAGTVVAVSGTTGWPTAAGIVNTITDLSDVRTLVGGSGNTNFIHAPGGVSPASRNNCGFLYVPSTGQVLTVNGGVLGVGGATGFALGLNKTNCD